MLTTRHLCRGDKIQQASALLYPFSPLPPSSSSFTLTTANSRFSSSLSALAHSSSFSLLRHGTPLSFACSTLLSSTQSSSSSLLPCKSSSWTSIPHTPSFSQPRRPITTLDPKSSFAGNQGTLSPNKHGRMRGVPAYRPPRTSNTQYVVDSRLRRIPRKRRRRLLFDELIPPDEDLHDPTWRIVASAIIQRGPVLNPPEKEWTKEWHKWSDEQDEKYGLHLDDWVFEEKSLPDSHKIWRPAPLETEDDLKNNRRTTNRRLRDDLFLLVKKDRDAYAWGFPQGGNFKGEALRETLDREIMEQLGEDLQVHTLGNHPHGYLKYNFPKDYQKYKKFKGAKVFLYRSLYIKGEVKLDTDLEEIVDFAWAARDELPEYLQGSALDTAMQMLEVPVPYQEVEYEEP